MKLLYPFSIIPTIERLVKNQPLNVRYILTKMRLGCPKTFCVTYILLILFNISPLFSQSVGINNPTPDPTAILDVTSNDKGILIPRMSGAQRVAIGGGAPATGLLVFDTDTSSFWYWNGVFWEELGPDTDWIETPTTVTTTKAVGIGTSSPDGQFEIEGPGNQYLRATTTSFNKTGIEFVSQGPLGDWRLTSDDEYIDLEFSTDDFATASKKMTWQTFNGSTRVGIGTSGPIQELDVVGTIRSSDLAGGGTRPVLANNSGDLILGSAATTKYYSMGPYSFESGNPTFTLNDYAYNTSSSSKIFAPVNLPDGATVTSVRIYYIDDSGPNNLQFSLYRRDVNLPNSIGTTMVSDNSFGNSGFSSYYETTITNPVIDNQYYYYEINVQPVVTHNWDGSLMKVKSVIISYTLP